VNLSTSFFRSHTIFQPRFITKDDRLGLEIQRICHFFFHDADWSASQSFKKPTGRVDVVLAKDFKLLFWDFLEAYILEGRYSGQFIQSSHGKSVPYSLFFRAVRQHDRRDFPCAIVLR